MKELRRGARDLGLEVEWNFHFIGPGMVVQSVRDGVFLDVGGHLTHGILDQHQDSSLARSTAGLILRYPEFAYGHLMNSWLELDRQGKDLTDQEWSPTIITHRNPDFDAVVAAVLVIELIETGGLPPWTRPLAEYSGLVDQGLYQVDLESLKTATHPIHMAFLGIQNQEAPEGVTCVDTWKINQGIDLIRLSIAALSREAGPRDLHRVEQFMPGSPGVDFWRDLPQFETIKELLDSDLKRYREDRAHAQTLSLRLPTLDDSDTLQVRTLVLQQPPSSVLSKYWVRAEGFPYFVCPYGKSESDGENHYPRVILSLDPEWANSQGVKPTLLGLGSALEQTEERYRNAHGGDTRGGTPRFSGGYCNNGDPWYDGRGHDYTIIDAPAEGSKLPYDEIIAIATGPFWQIPVEEAKVTLIRLHASSVNSESFDSALQIESEDISPMLRSYLDDCRIKSRGASASRKALPVPDGFHWREDSKLSDRRLPARFPMDLEMQVLENDPGRGTLEDLLQWVGTQHLDSANITFILMDIGFSRYVSNSRNLDRPLRDLVGRAGAQVLDLDKGDFRLLSGSSTVLIAGLTTEVSASTRWSQASLEVLIYVAFLKLSLRQFSERILRAMDTKGRLRGVSHIRKDFLNFQTRYYQVDVCNDPQIHQVFSHLMAGQRVAAEYAQVQSELDRLDQASQRDFNRKMEIVAFLIGLGAIIEAIGAMPFDNDYPWNISDLEPGSMNLKFWLMTALIPIAVISFIWLRWQAKERDPE